MRKRVNSFWPRASARFFLINNQPSQQSGIRFSVTHQKLKAVNEFINVQQQNEDFTHLTDENHKV